MVDFPCEIFQDVVLQNGAWRTCEGDRAEIIGMKVRLMNLQIMYPYGMFRTYIVIEIPCLHVSGIVDSIFEDGIRTYGAEGGPCVKNEIKCC